MRAFVPLTGLVAARSLPGARTCARRPAAARARPRACVARGPVDEEGVLELLRAPGKGPQQRGLLLARRLEPAARLRALLFSVRSSSNEWIRATAAVGLGQLRGADAGTRREAVRALLALLVGDSDFSIRSAAAAGCGYLGDDGGVEDGLRAEVVDRLIRGWFEDTEWQVKFSCLVSLGSLGDLRAVPVLVEALDSDNDLLVQGAVGALGDLHARSAVGPCLRLLASEDTMTRQRLAHALGGFYGPPAEDAVEDALRTLARDPSFAVRDAARDALTRHGLRVPEDSVSDEERIEREVQALLNGGAARDLEGAEGVVRRSLERAFGKDGEGGREEEQ